MGQCERQLLGEPVPPLWPDTVADELRGHLGRWVAIDDERIVAVADTLDEVHAQSEAQGVTEPLVFRVPANPGQVAVYRGAASRS